MRACTTIVADILGQNATEVGLIRDEYLVEAFGAHSAYPAKPSAFPLVTDDSISIGSTIRCQDGLHTVGGKYGFKGSRELGISIMDQKPPVPLLLLELPGPLPGLLGDPNRSG
jgi:hypothetical protein